MKYWLYFLCTLIILGACSSGSNKNISGDIVALGDSLTAGYGAPDGDDYPAVLNALTGKRVVNMGVSGDTSADIVHRLDEVIARQPALVLLGIGGNDFLRKIPESTTRDNIQQTIDRLKEHNIEVILIAEPHLTTGALFGSLSDHPMYRQLARDNNIAVFEEGWSAILSDKSLKSDMIHANGAGYRKFAENLRDFLQNQGFAI